MFPYLELDPIEAWEIEDTCYDSEVFFLEIVLKYILKSMENAHFYSELNGIVLFLMWWQTQTPERFKKKK